MSAEGERKNFRISQAKEQRRRVQNFACMCFFGVAAVFAAFFIFQEGFVWKIWSKSY